MKDTTGENEHSGNNEVEVQCITWGKIVNMGQGYSRQMFVHLLKDILKARGAKVEQKQVQKNLEFV